MHWFALKISTGALASASKAKVPVNVALLLRVMQVVLGI
jgi:hypothetical protein